MGVRQGGIEEEMKKFILGATIAWGAAMYLAFDLNSSFQSMLGIAAALIIFTAMAYSVPK